MDIDFDKAAANPWFASAIGSAISLKFMPGQTWGERGLNAFITYGSGVVGGGALVDHLGVTSGKSAAGVVLLTSALCLVIFQIVVQALKSTDWGAMLSEKVRAVLGIAKKEG
jgi:hypothetical protein